MINWMNLWRLFKLFEERYMAALLYNYPSNAFLYHEQDVEYLETHHFNNNLTLEYVFAAIPTIIVALIIGPSLFLLYSLDEDLDPKLTVKVIGNQWFWSYELFDVVGRLSNSASQASLQPSGAKLSAYNVAFDSVMVQESDLYIGAKRLLEVDKRLVLPVNVSLRFLITSADVLHSWAIPELGIKMDAVPGRLNQFITMICKPGIYYGQCSELCGVSHGFMPIVVKATTHENFLTHLVGYKNKE